MKNQKLNIFSKGDFQDIDGDFLSESIKALSPIQTIQKKYNKLDSDTFINEVRDSLVSRYLSFDLINIEKHGFDAKKDSCERFLEVKQVSFFF